MDAGLVGLSIFGVAVITQRPFLVDVNSGPFPMKMLCFFVQGFTEKVGIPYYTACMRNWCSVLGIFEESSVSYSLNSKMCGCIELMVWKELLHFSWLLILRILVLLLVPKVHQMPRRLKLFVYGSCSAFLFRMVGLFLFAIQWFVESIILFVVTGSLNMLILHTYLDNSYLSFCYGLLQGTLLAHSPIPHFQVWVMCSFCVVP